MRRAYIMRIFRILMLSLVVSAFAACESATEPRYDCPTMGNGGC